MPVCLPGEEDPSGLPPVPAGVTFGEGTIAGIFMEARYIIGSSAYNVKPGYMKRENMLNLSRLHS
jgi:hypothetical protein